ncbi:DICT sensory domain-containing protein [Halopenitus persicus]|uniref:DICT sensory domain-containing protein n=1 Tax=Halopenitus persicus TaxID=1048396 RepID=UPI000BBA6729|nr:DICT sensory domain-containing protein [Halopenitus persicus]
MADSLRAFIDRLEPPARSLVILNRSAPDAARRLLDGLFADQPVAVEELHRPEADETDVVALIEDGTIIARSTVDELLSTILLVNSDLYKTGSRELEAVELPAVLDGLTDVPFRLRGYPDSNKEKLLLITVSRVIERRAAEAGSGTLRSSFQYLSRLQDEAGTRTVYETVGRAGTDVHVYGVDDWDTAGTLPVTVHGGCSREYRRSWFVVFRPADPTGVAGDGAPDACDSGSESVPGPAALVALEDERNVWDGFWTYRPGLVVEIDAYLQRAL